MKQLSDDFVAWGKDYSGMDGGNPTSHVWFCGIEGGGGYKEEDLKSIIFNRDLEKDWISWSHDDLPYLCPKNHKESEDHITGKDPFNLNIAKIARKLIGEEISLYTELFALDGKFFKMNLYPLPFKTHDNELWSKSYYDKVGFLTKSQYKAWCMEYRFPKLNYLVKKYSPKCLVCFGNTLKEEYSVAFSSDENEIFSEFSQHTLVDDNGKVKTVFFKNINSNKTLLIVAPFPGKPHGLNSDDLLGKMADFIKTKLQEKQ